LYSYIYPHPGQINTTQKLWIYNFPQKAEKVVEAFRLKYVEDMQDIKMKQEEGQKQNS
jgi:hypothetical protein